jgi:hypothetical protein
MVGIVGGLGREGELGLAEWTGATSTGDTAQETAVLPGAVRQTRNGVGPQLDGAGTKKMGQSDSIEEGDGGFGRVRTHDNDDNNNIVLVFYSLSLTVVVVSSDKKLVPSPRLVMGSASRVSIIYLGGFN